MMRRKVIVVWAAVASAGVFAGPVLAQYVSGAVPSDARINSVEAVEVKVKAGKAKALIEEKGEEAFNVFHKKSAFWIGKDNPLFVVEATSGGDKEGTFLVYPDIEHVGDGAMEMSRMNGRHFARDTLKKATSGDDITWYGFVAGDKGKIPVATALATAPSGKKYAIAVAGHGLSQEKRFVKGLVEAAGRLIARRGEKAFDTFMEESSAFRYGDSYIYVLDVDGTMLLDPGHPEYNGKNVLEYPAVYHGFKYPVFSPSMEGAMELASTGAYPSTSGEFLSLAKDILFRNGSAWAAYFTGKPGEARLTRKVAYEKVVKGPAGERYIVGSGVYLVD